MTLSDRPSALFAYGTLIFPEVFEALTGLRPRSAEARLHDYAALLLHEAAYPGLRAEPGHTTSGRVYFDLGPDTWEQLDRFEGDLYEVRGVRVECGGVVRDAAAYVVAAAYLGRLSPRPWDPAQFARDGYDAFLAACRRYAAGHETGPP